MTHTRIARLVGSLMLAAFFLYGIGSSLATTATGPVLTIGVGMMLLNSAAVIAIGALVVPILRPRAPRIAHAYLATRVFEGALLAVGAIALTLDAVDLNFVAYNTAMAALGLGSLFFCAALYRSRLVPRLLAAWGFIGYASFALGSLLELAGVGGAGLVGAVPGGLFELFFGVWLIVKGFAVAPIRIPAQA